MQTLRFLIKSVLENAAAVVRTPTARLLFCLSTKMHNSMTNMRIAAAPCPTNECGLNNCKRRCNVSGFRARDLRHNLWWEIRH